jgi:hypothetical protein
MKLKFSFLLVLNLNIQFVFGQIIFFEDKGCCKRCHNPQELEKNTFPVIQMCIPLVQQGIAATLPPIVPDFSNLTSYFAKLQERKIITEDCMLTCIAQKMGLTDEVANLQYDPFKAYAKQNFISASWELTQSDAWVVDCINEGGPLPRYYLKIGNEIGQLCGARMKAFNRCVWLKRFLACPSERQMNFGWCFLLRNNLTTF